MGNMSVVCNYKRNVVFAKDDDPDVGYVQFTRSAGRVYITVDGSDVGFVPAEKFAEMASRFVEGDSTF